jgi:uncharacterized protein (DUF2384 family)
MSMGDQQYELWEILRDLELIRSHENKLIRALATLIDSPDASAVPEHVRRVFNLAREAFGDNAARFLMNLDSTLNHEAPIVVAQTAKGAQEVANLLGRIIHGICV